MDLSARIITSPDELSGLANSAAGSLVSNVAKSPGIVLVHPSLPAKGINDLIALAKVRPGQLRYASAALGSPSHLTGQRFTSAVGLK